MNPKLRSRKRDREDIPEPAASGSVNKTLQYAVGAALLALMLAVFWQMRHHDFFEYDDNAYVTNNPDIRNGITVESIRWAFTTGHASNWHPLTWLSHMLDCRLYGMSPGGHHLTSLWIHMANGVFLFFLLCRMTGNLWPSAFVAAVFAVHPLSVESVAWVAERKNVLSTFFWFLTMWTYVSYTERISIKRYLAVTVSLALGLMSKPMLVTVPLVLLLMDYWPLKRFESNAAGRLILEKIPLLVLSGASSLVTILVQRNYAAAAIESVSFPLRAANAFVSYVKYIVLTIWPNGLTFFYPHPGNALPAWQVIGSVLALAAISVMTVSFARRHPYVVVGWLWYILTLVPVIGLVQVGRQAMADRYAYVTLIGLYMAVAWMVADLTEKWRGRREVLGLLASGVILALAVTTWFQVRHWKNSVTIYEHAVLVTENNYLAHYNLGSALHQQGMADRAIHHYSEAVRIHPAYTKARLNLGRALAQQGKTDEAITQYTEAIRIEPNYADAHNNLGSLLARMGKLDEAIPHFSHVLRISPVHLNALNNLGAALLQQGHNDSAILHYSNAIRIEPNSPTIHYNLGIAFVQTGQLDRAATHFREALRIQPAYADAQHALERVRARMAEKGGQRPSL